MGRVGGSHLEYLRGKGGADNIRDSLIVDYSCG
jgi:hypothetical protein